MKYKHNFLLQLMLLSIVLNACGKEAVSVPTASPCTSLPYSYFEHVEQKLITIYENGARSDLNSPDYLKFQQQAFSELVNYVHDLSDSVDIDLGDKTVRITITYVSPQLIHALLVNHYLFKRNIGFIGKLDGQVNKQMEGIVIRNEHIFFITFIAFDDRDSSLDTSSITVDFPIEELQLVNTNNLVVNKLHDDQNLEEKIILENGLEYGFFYYPTGAMQNGICQTVLDKNRDTCVVLSIPKMNINDKEVGSKSWKYKYSPLLNVRVISLTPTPRFSETLTLPVYDIKPQIPQDIPKDLNNPHFWISLAQIIWLETTLDP